MNALEILVPLAARDGETFTEGHHAVLEAHLLAVFGGFSRLPTTWLAAGEARPAAAAVYLVVVNARTDAAKVRAVMAFARDHYGRTALSVFNVGVAAVC